jgi:hypothetical protein
MSLQPSGQDSPGNSRSLFLAVDNRLTNSLLTMSSIYLLFSLLFSSPRTTPTLPTTALPKPTALLVTIIICLVLHPIALLAGVAWRKTKDREGRIRLEEEVQEAEQAQLEAEEGERLRR